MWVPRMRDFVEDPKKESREIEVVEFRVLTVILLSERSGFFLLLFIFHFLAD